MFGWFKKKKQAPEVTAVHRLTPGKNLPDNYKKRAVRLDPLPRREVSQERIGDDLATTMLLTSVVMSSSQPTAFTEQPSPVAESPSCDYSRPEPVFDRSPAPTYDPSPSYSGGGDSGYSGGDGGSSCSSGD